MNAALDTPARSGWEDHTPIVILEGPAGITITAFSCLISTTYRSYAKLRWSAPLAWNGMVWRSICPKFVPRNQPGNCGIDPRVTAYLDTVRRSALDLASAGAAASLRGRKEPESSSLKCPRQRQRAHAAARHLRRVLAAYLASNICSSSHSHRRSTCSIAAISLSRET